MKRSHLASSEELSRPAHAWNHAVSSAIAGDDFLSFPRTLQTVVA